MKFDDPSTAARWDAPASLWSPASAPSSSADFPSVRARLIWEGHLVPAPEPTPVVGLAAGVKEPAQ